MTSVRPMLYLMALLVLLGAASLALIAATGGLSPSLIEADEGGHYVNALFLGDWLRSGLASPLPFAKGFYAHFPRLTIGHWPPGWYMIEAPVFAALHPSPLVAEVASTFLAGLPGVAVWWGLARSGRPLLGVALAFAYVALPLVIDTGRYVLVDQPLTLLVAAAAIAWAAASDRPTWGRMLGFALLAAACPLVKGNGALIALVPPLDIALTGRWRLLARAPLWGAAALALAIVAPWYWLSFAISADGFNYVPGASYAWLAFHDNVLAIVANVGVAGVALAVVGAVAAWRQREAPAGRVAWLAVAVVAATLLFQSAVPASLAPRYVAPLLPWLVVLIGSGLLALARLGRVGTVAAAALGLASIWPAAAMLRALPPKPDLGAPAIATAMTARGGVWLIDGSAGAEGALIAAAAHADDGRRRVWAIRASQWLSTSDFMGRGYRLTVANPVEAQALLDRLGVAGVVSVAKPALAYPHSALLRAAVGDGRFGIERRRFLRGQGEVLIATRRAPITANAALIDADPGSAKVGKMLGRF